MIQAQATDAGAQRLSASTVLSPVSLSQYVRSVAAVLNAFRHQRFSHACPMRFCQGSSNCSAQRLSASKVLSHVDRCYERRRRDLGAQRLSASMVLSLDRVAVRAAAILLVLNAFRHQRFSHRPDAWASVRCGIKVLNAFRHQRFSHSKIQAASLQRKSSAQRLSASKVLSQIAGEQSAGPRHGAQRLSASKVLSRIQLRLVAE